MKLAATVSLAALALAGCAASASQPAAMGAVEPAPPPPTVNAGPVPDAGAEDALVAQAERELGDLSVFNNRAAWINQTNITDDTDALAATVDSQFTAALVRYATEASKFQNTPGLSADTTRKLYLLRTGIPNAAGIAAPSDPVLGKQLADLKAKLQSTYGKGRATLNGKVITGDVAEEEMGTLRDPKKLQEVWTSWNNNVGRPMRPDYVRLVDIANQGAKELGFADTGAMWRAGYDMSPEEFAAMYDRLWNEVKPLYDCLLYTSPSPRDS